MDACITNFPDHILEMIFSHLDLYTLGNCLLVCKQWHQFLNNNENNDIWRIHCKKKLSKETLSSDLLSSVSSFKGKLRAYYYAWNPNDCSRNIYTKFNDFILHRNPIAQSTDACRGKIGFRHGRHAWEVIWEGPLGTVAVIGIATKEAALVCQGYVALLGMDEHSWGWNLVDNNLLHNGDMQGNYPLPNNAPKYQERLLLKTGGSTIDKAVKNFLNSTLSNEIGAIYTWTGIRKGSKKMNGTVFASLIVSTYSNNLNATIQSVENAIAVWLRRTSDRINNFNKSKNAQLPKN